MNIDKAARLIQLGRLLQGFIDADIGEPDDYFKSWVDSHLKEFWRLVNAPRVDIYYTSRNALTDRNSFYKLSLDNEDQVELAEYDGNMNEWHLVDKSHSPEAFFRKLNYVMSWSRFANWQLISHKILTDGQYSSEFSTVVANLEKKYREYVDRQ